MCTHSVQLSQTSAMEERRTERMDTILTKKCLGEYMEVNAKSRYGRLILFDIVENKTVV